MRQPHDCAPMNARAVTVTAPPPTAFVQADPSTHGVPDYVVDGGRELAVVPDALGLEWSLEEMAIPAMATLEVARVRAQQALHPVAEVRLRRTDDDVEVVPHQAVRMDFPAVGLDDAFQDREKDLTIAVIAE